MMTNEDFCLLAYEAGFKACCFLPPVKTTTSLQTLVTDPKSVLPDARTVIMLFKTYAPSGKDMDVEAVVSAYYPASHAAYRAAKKLASRLTEAGYQAVSNVQLPLKKLMRTFGIGEQGKNSLISIPGFGSAFHVQAIVTNASFQYTYERNDGFGLAARCLHCDKCIQACPTGAILGDGRIEASKCLRSISEADPIPYEYEALLGNHLLGCDICQSVCPVNALVEKGTALRVSLKNLLKGDIEDLKALIGANYARTGKLKKKATVIAANTKRRDLIPELTELTGDKEPSIAKAARHALDRLEENK